MLRIDQLSKLHALEKSLARAGSCVLAVSGGLDSRLLSFVAARVDADVLCVHLAGPHMAASETSRAVVWLESLGLPYSVLDVDPLTHSAVADNRRDRCYHCKHLFFSAVRAHAPARGPMDGSNASDHTVYRPGLKALAELGVKSPLADCGATKDDIRALARDLRLADPGQPSTPCLLTRLPYDTTVDPADLARIADLEDQCRARGFTHFRVRMVDDAPVLFAHPRHRGLDTTLPVRWVDEVSGFWDAQDRGKGEKGTF